MTTPFDQIEILSVSLLESQRTTVEEMRRISKEVIKGLGWHYLLDLSWAIKILQPKPGQYIMDAGAGLGVMQWWLAVHGINVLSVDCSNRTTLDSRFYTWCQIKGLRPQDLRPFSRPGLIAFLPPSKSPQYWHLWPGKFCQSISRFALKEPKPPESRGTVTIYNHDLSNLPDIPNDSVDAIISISALEHNNPETLRGVVKELMRVIKPGGKLVATLGAAKEHDWFHEPSKGWCYTEATLQDLFGLSTNCWSNYSQYTELFERLQNCPELRDNLAKFYSKSNNNGMPWGIWKPKYQPVGVIKIKHGVGRT